MGWGGVGAVRGAGSPQEPFPSLDWPTDQVGLQTGSIHRPSAGPAAPPQGSRLTFLWSQYLVWVLALELGTSIWLVCGISSRPLPGPPGWNPPSHEQPQLEVDAPGTSIPH